MSSLQASSLHVNVSALSAIVMNAKTGKVIYEKDAYLKRYPASTTKLATGLFVIHLASKRLKEGVAAKQAAIGALSTSEKIRRGDSAPAYTLEHGSCHIGIKRGEILTIETLLYGLMLASGNDAANVLAQHLGGSIPEFTRHLNEYIKKIGCKDTHFLNPHGLHHKDQVTTAYDLALLGREAMKNPLLRKIVGTQRYSRPKTNKQEKTMLSQTNRLIKKGSKYFYSKCSGIKTGYTKKAGYCLVASASQDDRELIAVVLKSSSSGSRFKDAKELFEAAFKEPKLTRHILKKGKQKWVFKVGDAKEPLQTYLDDDYAIHYYPSEEPNLKVYIERFPLELPFKKGTIIGEVKISLDDEFIHEVFPLKALKDVDLKLTTKLVKFWSGYGEASCGFMGVLFAGLAMFTWKRKS